VSLFRLVQEGGHCLDCSPFSVAHIGMNTGDNLCVPVLDVYAANDEAWGGTHVYFTIPGLPVDQCPWGHLIVRNLNLNNLHATRLEEELESVRRHELVHVMQSLSGLDRDLLTDRDLELCCGFPALIPKLVAARRFEKGDAFGLCARWFLQSTKMERDAYQSVEIPRYERLYSNDYHRREFWRAMCLFFMLQESLRAIGCALLDTYDVSWSDFLAAVEHGLLELTAGSFLEAAMAYRGWKFTPLSLLRSLELRHGLMRDMSGGRMPFGYLLGPIPRFGSIGVYNPMTEEGKAMLAGSPKG
jgi:hypothetical protein